MNDATQGLLAAMAEHGLEPGTIIWDGKIQRFRGPSDRKGEKDGWYKAFPDPPEGAAFGYWKSGLKGKWSNKNGRPDDYDPAKMKEAWAERDRLRDEAQQKLWD